MIPASYPAQDDIARLTAGMLLDIKAVHFNSTEPFTLASGLPSPTYIDCRKLISYPRIRSTLMDFLTERPPAFPLPHWSLNAWPCR